MKPETCGPKHDLVLDVAILGCSITVFTHCQIRYCYRGFNGCASHLVAGLFDINKRIIGNIGLGVSQNDVARHHDH